MFYLHGTLACANMDSPAFRAGFDPIVRQSATRFVIAVPRVAGEHEFWATDEMLANLDENRSENSFS